MYLSYHAADYPDNFTTVPFQIISVHLVSYDANWHSTMHHHKFAEIFYCLSGTGHLQTDFGRQAIQANSLVLVNPFIEHTEHTSLDQPLRYLVIGIEGPEIILPSQASDSGLFHFDDRSRQFYPFIEQIIKECEQPAHYSNQLINHLVNAILLRLSNITQTHLSQQKAITYSASVTLAKNYMDNNYSKNITLESLEQRTHVSRFHLAHLFKDEMGMSPISYLHKVRFQRAKELLRTTNYTVLQIAELVGFNSVTYFSTKFKEITGSTPRQYRQTTNHDQHNR